MPVGPNIYESEHLANVELQVALSKLRMVENLAVEVINHLTEAKESRGLMDKEEADCKAELARVKVIRDATRQAIKGTVDVLVSLSDRMGV